MVLVRNRVSVAQSVGAGELAVRALDGRLRASELRTQSIDFSLERTWVDLEQQVAAADHGALGETNGGDEPGHSGADFDGVDGLKAAGEFVPLGHVALDDVGDGDLWRRRRCGLCGGLHARGEHRGERDWRQQQRDARASSA